MAGFRSALSCEIKGEPLNLPLRPPFSDALPLIGFARRARGVRSLHHQITVVTRIAKYPEPLCAFDFACPEGFQPIRSRVFGLSM
jgi:hypothetical protein